MKKFLVSAIALSTMLWVGCGGDDDDPPPVDNTVTVTADTTTAPATPLVYNDAVWNNVTATSITLSTGNPLPVSPVKTPLGPDKSLSAPSTVELQAIKKGGRLYLRFQWDDASLSMQREQWKLSDVGDFNFQAQTQHGEDQVVALFEDHPDSAWDLWNWRVLTTGVQNRAEDGAMLDGIVAWDAGVNKVAARNATPGDNSSPQKFPETHGEFTGDILYKSETINRSSALEEKDTWTLGQTIPGWYINDDVDWGNITESRWDIQAVHHYDAATNQYTLVMVRDLTAHEDDVDMSELTRIKTRIGVIDDEFEIATGHSKRKFSVDFWLKLP